MDNQFRRKTNNDSYASRRINRRQEDDSDVIDLYSDFKDPDAGKLEPEVEELKLMAQSDALRFYGWVRKHTEALFSKLQWSKRFLNRFSPKMALGASGLLVVAFIGSKVVSSLVGQESGGILGLNRGNSELNFPVLEPESAEASTVFDDEVGVAITRDDIDGTSITISQQAVPEEIKQEPSKTEELALALSDKVSIDHLTTDKGQVYVVKTTAGTNTVIFAHEERLVFIRSSAILDNNQWVDYINNLR